MKKVTEEQIYVAKEFDFEGYTVYFYRGIPYIMIGSVPVYYSQNTGEAFIGDVRGSAGTLYHTAPQNISLSQKEALVTAQKIFDSFPVIKPEPITWKVDGLTGLIASNGARSSNGGRGWSIGSANSSSQHGL